MSNPKDYPIHEEVGSLHGVASSAHPLATQAALDALRRGGSAVDAAIAAGAVLTVVMPTAGALGGDCFFLVRDGDGEVGAVNGSGAAPEAATVEHYQGQGEIPDTGWQAASVPGIVDGWRAAHERWGKLDWDTLFDGAIQAAEGFVVTDEIANRYTSQTERLTAFPETARIFYAGGQPPKPGSILRQSDLAGSFQSIAHEGPATFYTGELAAEIAAASSKEGGLITASDLANHRTQEPDPIKVTYRGHTIHGQPPVSQGIVLLMGLGTLNEFKPGGDNWQHLKIEAIKQGFADRLQWLGDPEFVDVPIEMMLSEAQSQVRAKRIDPNRSSPIPMPQSSPDTTSLVTADSDGNVVAYIHSLYAGCGVVVPSTGIMLNNRMRGFSLDPSSPNVLAPGKRPIHTLNTALIENDERVVAICTPGASWQVQHNLQVISYLIDDGMSLQAAADAPRWSLGDQLSIGDLNLMIESRFGEAALDRLREMGHDVHVEPAWAVGGGIQLAQLDLKTGALLAARDPRRASNLAAAL